MLQMAQSPKHRSNEHIEISPLYIDFRLKGSIDLKFANCDNWRGCWSSPLTAQFGQMTPTKKKEISLGRGFVFSVFPLRFLNSKRFLT